MFAGFARVWTPLLPVAQVKSKPVPVTLAGEPLVVFRGKDGQIGVLLDRCPHRGVSLSLGTVKESGGLACPFHDWRFGADGEVMRIPLNPDAKRERLFAHALPSRVLGDLVWVYTDAAERNPPEPQVPDGLTLPTVTRTYLEVNWAAHWTRVMENMLDSPHVPFVHKGTIGKPMQGLLTPDARMDVNWEERPYGGRSHMVFSNRPQANLAYLEFYRPNIMALHIPIPGKHFRMHAVCVPEAQDRTRLIVIGSRDFATPRFLNPFFNYANGRIAAEDKAVVESSPPGAVPRPSEEVSVASDRATLQFRKYYFEALHDSSSGTRPRGAPTAKAFPPF